MNKSLDHAFVNFYKKTLESKHPELKKHEVIDKIIIDCVTRTITFSENISIIFLIILILFFSYITAKYIDLFHFNLLSLIQILGVYNSYCLLIVTLFFGFEEKMEKIPALLMFLLNYKERPAYLSRKLFYYCFYDWRIPYIDKISRKIIINKNCFYDIIKETDYSTEELTEIKNNYKLISVEDNISLEEFNEIIHKAIKIKHFERPKAISTFFYKS